MVYATLWDSLVSVVRRTVSCNHPYYVIETSNAHALQQMVTSVQRSNQVYTRECKVIWIGLGLYASMQADK